MNHKVFNDPMECGALEADRYTVLLVLTRAKLSKILCQQKVIRIFNF